MAFGDIVTPELLASLYHFGAYVDSLWSPEFS